MQAGLWAEGNEPAAPKKPDLCHKKNPKQSYALGVPELLLQLRLLLAGRRGVGGWGAARLAYMDGK